MPNVRFDTYYRYNDLARILREFADAYPKLVKLDSIGKSYEGRDVWLATVTNTATGPDTEKPALWVDGNIHASEVSASSACLYLLHKLTQGYGTDPNITRCLDTRVFYICPRVNPDGAEWALADRPKIIRSSTRPYPFDEDAIEGLQREDVDGDGRLLYMRIPDPNGPWKPWPQDPRLLVKRDPAETGGQYYRLLPEGTLVNYDGVTLKTAPIKEGLDLNRNFPAGWRAEGEQTGAGPFPSSEPEVHNLVRFITSHPNITGGIAFHTWSGVLLRPFSDKNDESFPAEDLWTYQAIGQKGTDLTGYPHISVYHDFRYHPKEVITGAFDDWLVNHWGTFGWTVELWSPQRQAGIEKFKYIDWTRDHPIEDDAKLLKWNDEVLGGKGYVNWYPFNHPQLGPVELGGWDVAYAWRNPPPQFLEKELEHFPKWLVWHLLISPRLEILEASATPLGADAYQIRLVVANTGWLPTYVMKLALERKIVRGVVAEIELPEGATLASGQPRVVSGQLEGRAYKDVAAHVWITDPTDDRLKLEWVVKAPQGGKVKLKAHHQRAGTARAELELKPI